MMEEMNDTQPTVKSMGMLEKSLWHNTENLLSLLEAYETSRSTDATEEEKFNEGRHGRAILMSIDATHQALNALRMRVSLQVEGRDSARARQLDRILGMSEEDTKLVDAMLDIAKKVVDGQRDDGSGTT